MWDTAGEVGTNSQVKYSGGPLHMDEQRQDDQLEPIYNSSVPIQDVALKTYRRERWVIEKGGGRGSGRSVLVGRHHGDDDDSWLVDCFFLQHVNFLLLTCHKTNK